MKMPDSAYWSDDMATLPVWGFKFHFVSELAVGLIERLALVAAKDDGEDSMGRSKLKLLSAEEVVMRAFSIAEIFLAECERRGYVQAREKTYSRDAAWEKK